MEYYDAEGNSIEVKERKSSIWSKIGGGPLMFAAIFHLILLTIGAFWIFQIIRAPEKEVNFIPPGGGGGERGAEHQVQKKKQAQITPTTNVKRVFVENRQSDFIIPEQGDDFGQLSPLASLGGGGMSGGLGGSGMGKGFGKGPGAGGGLGTGGTLGIKMFGTDLNVKSIGVVLDVSGSMTPHLQRVLEEVNRVAEGSPVVLHVGCGIGEGRSKERFMSVEGPGDRFKRFWYLQQDRAYVDQRKNPRAEVDLTRPIPQEEVYKMLADRPKTFFINYEGVGYAKNALLADQLRNVEAIYWFADFQDPISPKEAEEVREGLGRRKQKLFIHASGKNGQYQTAARDLLAIPTGGSELKDTAP